MQCAVMPMVAPATWSTGIMSRMARSPAGMLRWPLMPAKARGAEVVKPSFHPGKGKCWADSTMEGRTMA
jgi:hypothetical protein